MYKLFGRLVGLFGISTLEGYLMPNPVCGLLFIIWKSDTSDEIKWDFLQTVVVPILLYECTTWILTNRTLRET